MQNSGKKFEQIFSSSVPEYCLLQRLPDPPQSFVKSETTKFSVKNPCDYLLFDSISKILYCLELKSTKNKYINWQKGQTDSCSRMIKYHQIESLLKFSKFENVTAGFIYNFRDDENHFERTYFQNIIDFRDMCEKINKSSFNEIDLLNIGNAIIISGTKKRTRYTWNIDEFLKKWR